MRTPREVRNRVKTYTTWTLQVYANCLNQALCINSFKHIWTQWVKELSILCAYPAPALISTYHSREGRGRITNGKSGGSRTFVNGKSFVRVEITTGICLAAWKYRFPSVDNCSCRLWHGDGVSVNYQDNLVVKNGKNEYIWLGQGLEGNNIGRNEHMQRIGG